MKKILLIGMCIVILLFTSINVYALGVAPSKNIVDIDNANNEYTGSILNNNHKDMNIVIIAQGEYAKYVTISEPYISIIANENEKEFKYTLNLPADISSNLQPGPTNIILLVAELPDKASASEQTTVKSLLSIEHQLVINVPYPGVFAEGVFFINEGDVNETIHFAVNVVNKGTEDIKNINGELVIKGPTNEELIRVKSNTVGIISSKASDKLFVDYVANINPGVYYAEFIVNYNGKQFVLRKTFTVDKLNAEVSDVTVEDFRLGYISKVNIEIINRWNQPIDEAYAYLQVINPTGDVVSETKTASSTLTQLSRTTLSGYWDTKGVNVGTYDVRVILHYNDQVSEKIFDAVIGIDDIQIVNPGATGLVTGKGSSTNSDSPNILLYIIVSILVVVNVFLVVAYFKYVRKKNEP